MQYGEHIAINFTSLIFVLWDRLTCSINPFQYGTQSRHKILTSTIHRARFCSVIGLGTLKADSMIMNHSTKKVHLNDKLFQANELSVFFHQISLNYFTISFFFPPSVSPQQEQIMMIISKICYSKVLIR